MVDRVTIQRIEVAVPTRTGAQFQKERATRKKVARSDTDWQRVDAGRLHTCGLKTNGTLWCWGEDSFGQLGSSFAAPVIVPLP